jgi:hypothetical protein
MRALSPTRVLGNPTAVDIAYLIDQQPATISVYRTGESFQADAQSRTLVASFTGRIDPYLGSRSTDAMWHTSRAGEESSLFYVLIAPYGTDAGGNTVALSRGDEVEDGTNLYQVLYDETFAGLMHQALLLCRS